MAQARDEAFYSKSILLRPGQVLFNVRYEGEKFDPTGPTWFIPLESGLGGPILMYKNQMKPDANTEIIIDAFKTTRWITLAYIHEKWTLDDFANHVSEVSEGKYTPEIIDGSVDDYVLADEACKLGYEGWMIGQMPGKRFLASDSELNTHVMLCPSAMKSIECVLTLDEQTYADIAFVEDPEEAIDIWNAINRIRKSKLSSLAAAMNLKFRPT